MNKRSWPYILVSILLMIGFAFLYGCGNPTGGGGGGGGGSSMSMITLTGHITSGSGYNVSTTWPTISKVVIFNCNGGFWVANVSGGIFTGEAEAGDPVGLIFAGPKPLSNSHSNNFLGYLTMGSSIDSLPLNLVNSSTQELDLNTLFFNAGVATTEYDLIGNALSSALITTSDVAAVSFANGTFANLVRNPDADGNSQVDILESPAKYYRPFMLYFVNGGTFEGSDLTPTIEGTSATIRTHRFCVDIYDAGGSLPDEITVNYPSGGGTFIGSYDAINAENTPTRRLYYCDAVNGTPTDGAYAVTYKTSTLTFEVSGQTEATQYIALAIPTITTTEGDNVQKVNWIYKLAGGSGASISPESLIKDLIIQLDDSSYTMPRPYDSPNLPSTVTEHYLTKTVSWDLIQSMNMAYNDVYGNHIVVTWYKPAII